MSLFTDQEKQLAEAAKKYANDETEEAVRILKQIIAKDATTIDAHLNLGTIYYEDGKLEKALEHYQLIIEQDNLYAIAWYFKSIVLCDLKKFSEAIEASTMALALNPENNDAWSNHGYILNQTGNVITQELFDKLKQEVNKKRKKLGLSEVHIP